MFDPSKAITDIQEKAALLQRDVGEDTLDPGRAFKELVRFIDGTLVDLTPSEPEVAEEAVVEEAAPAPKRRKVKKDEENPND